MSWVIWLEVYAARYISWCKNYPVRITGNATIKIHCIFSFSCCKFFNVLVFWKLFDGLKGLISLCEVIVKYRILDIRLLGSSILFLSMCWSVIVFFLHPGWIMIIFSLYCLMAYSSVRISYANDFFQIS